MKKILLSLATVALVGVGVVGATQAYFTDTATITGNHITTASMDLMFDSNPAHGDTNDAITWTSGTFANPLAEGLLNLKPGDTLSQDINILNVGGVDGLATIQFVTSDTDDLLDNLYIKVSFSPADDGNYTIETGRVTLRQWNDTVKTRTLGEITGANDGIGGQTGKDASVKIDFDIPATVGNEIQGEDVNVNIVLGVEQH